MLERIETRLPFGAWALGNAARRIQGLLGSRGCFFTFHRAAAPDVWATLPNRNFYLDLQFLDTLLEYLKASGRRIVTVEEGRRLSAAGADGGSYVNFSVDDCYRDTYEAVVPLFRRHQVPVTLFVTTGIPDGTMPMWGAGLEDALQNRDRVVLDGQVVEVASIESKMAVFQAVQQRWDGPSAGEHYTRFCVENELDEQALHWKHAISWEMLSELANDPLVEIGSHTVMHPRISSLSDDGARAELAGSRVRLQERLSVPVDHFAFPYGRAKDCGPRDFDIARVAGYKSVATTTKGVVRRGPSAYAFPRNTLNGGHRKLVLAELHMSGATGLAARMLGHG
ncbi:polysaccharide deacetylase family protein [Rhizobium sp. PAMB 3182]